MSGRFRVELSGWTGLIDALSPHLQSPELHLEKDADRTFLVSSRFDALSSRDEVMAEAQRALPLIVAAMRLSGLRPMPIQANRVEEQTRDGPQSTVYAFAFSASAVIAAPGASRDDQSRPAAPIPVEIGLRDEHVARALELFARDPSWYDLYKVLEVIEEDVGGEKALAGKGWASRIALKRFTATANNLVALGSDARHAISTWKPPVSPMTLDDAVVLIGQVLSAWIAAK